MKLKVGLPCDCRACVNQRNLIAENMIVPWTSLKLAGLDIVNNLVTTIRSSKTSLQCSWAYFWLLCIHTDKCNFHNNFERTACTSSTNLFLFTKSVRSQAPYASMYILCWQHFILSMKLQEVLIFYLYIQKYPPFLA